MPLHPAIRARLDRAAALPPLHTLTVGEARTRLDAMVPELPPPAEVGSVREQAIAGPGGALRLRIYTPAAPGPWGMLVFIHGGGFVLCGLDTHDGMCRNLCAGARCLVLSVDYRLAPEHRFPAATEDCLVATKWAAAHAGELGCSADRMVVGGDSAGGNLAAVTAIRLRDEGGPTLRGQLLIYPVTADVASGMPSYVENAEGFWLTTAGMAWFWKHYLGEEGNVRHPHAAPLYAGDLRRLPPALIQTAEYDPLRDEGERFGEQLLAAGVPALMTRWRGMNHGFMFWVGMVGPADMAMREACGWLRAAMATTPD